MSDKKFYITSPIFYPNANLHMGHAYTMTMCDILARYRRLVGDTTYFLTGADENTGKVIKAAEAKNQTMAEYLDSVSAGFKGLYSKLGITFDQFIRTTDKQRHWPGAIRFWQKLVEAGDIYKSTYEGLYCPSCEAFYTEKDLIDGKCPIHLTVPEKIKEENYFFKLSKYTEPVKKAISSDEFRVIPNSRKNEIMALLERGLEDVSFSRPIKNVPHGIPVPNDPEQVIYVWCDALVNYVSALGYGSADDRLFQEFWPADVHVIGKDILRFHAAIWPAMLLAAGLKLPKSLLVHGFITSAGHKMSKSLGNVIDPNELIDGYGTDAVRYYFARGISPFEDGDMTRDGFRDSYNANLANGLGNLVSRVMKMAISYEVKKPELVSDEKILSNEELKENYHEFLEKFEVNKAADYIWGKISELDRHIQSTEPFRLFKTDPEKAKSEVSKLVEGIWSISTLLKPFLPESAEKIKDAIIRWEMPEALFMRK